MLKEFLWDTFTNTGDINVYMLYKQIEESCKEVNDREYAEQEVAISRIG
jgi:hypothetical protein